MKYLKGFAAGSLLAFVPHSQDYGAAGDCGRGGGCISLLRCPASSRVLENDAFYGWQDFDSGNSQPD
jgi:hypothetical protein